MADLWIPGAVHRPGPAAKTGYPWATVRAGAGVVFHTPEGSFAGTLRELDGPASHSWHGTVDRDGTIYQHYPLDEITWHAGASANPYYPGFEFVDNLIESITDAQIVTAVRIINHLVELDGWPAIEHRVTLREHNEFMPTSCPSGFFPWDNIIAAAGPVARPNVSDVARIFGWLVYRFAEGADAWDLNDQDRRTVDYIVDRIS